MTLKNRGLGRGLEALLVDISAKEDNHQPAKDVGQDEIQAMPVVVDDCMNAGSRSVHRAQTEEIDDRTAMMIALLKNIQRENLILLEEAETLRKLIEEFESIVRADLS